MKILGLTISRTKAAPPGSLAPVVAPGGQSSFLGFVAEAFAGAWQRGIVKANRTDLLANSAVYSCVTLIASHISMMCPKLMEETADGVDVEVDRPSPYWQVLRRPNHFQTWLQFCEQWQVSKLLYGNAYSLIVRDARGVPIQFYLLHPERCRPLVAPTGDVFYAVSTDNLSGVSGEVTVPASEIIHDRMTALWHPLVGVSPITACAAAGGLGNKIAENSEKFFGNFSRPSGILYSPVNINDQLAADLKRKWDENYSGEKIGQTAVLAGGLKYEPMSIPANDAQLIEQLRWTVEDVARCFHVPLFMIGAAPIPATSSVEFLTRLYYTQTLQPLIEQMESCLESAMGLESIGYEVELDEESLLRMDQAGRFDAYERAIRAGWMAPNEARRLEGLRPVDGGDTPYMQQQNWALAQLAQRTPPTDAPAAPVAAAAPAPADQQQAAAEVERLRSDLAAAREQAVDEIRARDASLAQLDAESRRAAERAMRAEQELAAEREARASAEAALAQRELEADLAREFVERVTAGLQEITL